MRTFFSLLCLVAGAGLCLLDAITSAFVHAPAIKLYHEQLAAVPYKESYTRAEYTAVAWQVWTNRVYLGPKEAYTADELRNALFGLGTHQDSCDRQSLEGLVANASGYRRNTGSGTTIPGVLVMLLGAFLLGGVVFPQREKP